MAMKSVIRDNYFESPPLQAHKKQRFWQIIFPVVLFSLLLLTGLVFLIVRDGRFSPGVEEIGGVATVLVILPILLIALLQLALLIAIIYGVSRLKTVISPTSAKILQFMEKARWNIRKGADISVQPILGYNQNGEKAKQVFRSLNTRLRKKGINS